MGKVRDTHIPMSGIPPGDCEIHVGKTHEGVSYIQIKSRSAGDTAQLFDFVRYRLGMSSPAEMAFWREKGGEGIRELYEKPLKPPKTKHK